MNSKDMRESLSKIFKKGKMRAGSQSHSDKGGCQYVRHDKRRIKRL